MDYRTAVEKTIAYGRFFRFPMSPSEIHYWLISPMSVSYPKIAKYLNPLSNKEQKYKTFLQNNTNQKISTANQYLNCLHSFPFLRLVALTGSVAAQNTKPNDDLDLLIIASPNTLWLVRPFLLFFFSLHAKLRRSHDHPGSVADHICPNLWLDTTALTVPQNRQNIYTAHEVLQVKPLLDRGDTYQKFLQANRWTSKYLANAYHQLSGEKKVRNKKSFFSIIFIPLNLFFYLVQYLYMLPKITVEKISPHFAYFHKNDLFPKLKKHLQTKTSQPLKRRYNTRSYGRV